MGKLKWMLPVLIAVVVLGSVWWFFRARTYTAQELMTRDNAAILLIVADMDEKRLVELKQEVQKLRTTGNPTERAEADRVHAILTNAIRTRGIDERKFLK
jgi:hypothetical protein